jgi:hypothetical protein
MRSRTVRETRKMGLKGMMIWLETTKVSWTSCFPRREIELTIIAGGEGGISGKGTDIVQIEPDSILTPEPTPRWGVVMAQQAQFEGN